MLSLISGTQEAEAVQSLFAKASRGLLIQHTTHDLMLELLDKITATEGLRRFSLFLEAIDLLSHTSDYEFLASEHYHNPMTVKDAGRFNDVYHFLMANYHRKISLDEVATVAKRVPTAFCRYFKARTQKSFVSLLQEIRIAHAVSSSGRTNYPLCMWHPKAVITISSISTNVFATSPGGAPARGAGS